MSIDIRCGACDAPFSVPETLLGKKIKCKSCGEAIPVIAAAAKPAAKPIAKAGKPAVVADDEDEDRRPSPKKNKVAAAFDDDEDDFEERPRGRNAGKSSPAAKKKSALPMILVGLVGLMVLGGGAVAAVVFSGVLDDKQPEPGWTPPDMAKMMAEKGKMDPPQDDAAEMKVDKKDDKKPEKKADSPKTDDADKKDEPKPGDGEDKPEEPKKKNLLPVPTAPPGIGNGPSGGINTAPPSGKTAPDAATIERAKKATVYIEVEVAQGGASGSGWFGMENNLIFTNAHVMGMLAPSAPKPKKITVYLNSGTPQQRVIPHSKLELLVVDRHADLAVLRVLNEKDLPVPLQIRHSEELKDLEPLVILGYPGGRNISQVFGKNSGAPKATLSTTSFSSNLYDEDGNLWSTQIRGGAGPGNSGGPIIDTDGNVVAVLVRGPAGRLIQYAAFINYGVPTEFVSGVLAGRVSEVEYGQPYLKDGKTNIPVKVAVLDPYNRMKEVGIGVWIGEKAKKPRSPGKTRTGVEPSDSGYQEIKLEYKWTKEKQFAEGIITFPELPSGQVYWAQPYYTNAIVTKYYMAGQPVKMSGPPVALEEADLVARPKFNSRRPVTLTTSSDLEESEVGEETNPSDKQLLETEIKGFETVEKSADANDLARLRVNYEKLSLKVPGDDGEKEDILTGPGVPKDIRALINRDIKNIQGFGFVKKDGEIYKTLNDVRGAPQTASFLKKFSGDVMDALQYASIPLPGGRKKPGENWTIDKNTRFVIGFQVIEQAPATGGDPPAGGGGGGPGGPNGPRVRTRTREYKYTESVTYKYIGTRVRLGSKEAVLEIRGVIKPSAGTAAGASGTVKGYAFIDLDTGTVLESNVKKEFSMDSSGDGIKKVVGGIFNYNVSRGSATTN